MRILVLSDRDSTADLAPIPSLLLTAAVHQHLVREQTRTQVALVVESGDCREVHHVAVLIGYGAAAVNPYLAFEIGRGPDRDRRAGRHRAGQGGPQLRQGARQGRPEDHVQDGHLDRLLVLRRPGLRGGRPGRPSWSSATSPAPPSTIGGVGLAEIHAEVAARHATAYPANAAERAHRRLEVGGEYQWRREGELHLFNPETVFLLQHATRSRQYDVFQQYTVQGGRAGRRRPARCAGCSGCATGDRPAGAARRGRAGQRDRQAVRHRRDVLRLDLGGGARDPRHRDEPARRQVQHRRGRRGRRAAARPGAAARRSSRSPAAGSASPPNTWSTPTTCRSRWRRAPSPARAASCPATRCGRGSPRPGTPPRASG